MENAGRHWIERLGLSGLRDLAGDGSEQAAAGPVSLAVPLLGGLVVAVTLYMLGAVALVQGGGLAAITLGTLEIVVARAVTVPSPARSLPTIASLIGLVTVVVGIVALLF